MTQLRLQEIPTYAKFLCRFCQYWSRDRDAMKQHLDWVHGIGENTKGVKPYG